MAIEQAADEQMKEAQQQKEQRDIEDEYKKIVKKYISPVSKPKSKIYNLPGEVYQLIGDYLGEKLPLIIFTNRLSFKTSLDFQSSLYDTYISQANIQLSQFNEILTEIPQSAEEIILEMNEIEEVIAAYRGIRDNILEFRNLVK